MERDRSRPSPTQLRKLKALFGERFSDDRASLDRCSKDQVGDPTLYQRPVAVVQPKSTEDVVALIQWANRTKTPITPRGGGSGLAGAAIPAEDGVVCSFAAMDRILEIDGGNLMVEVEPGVVTNALDEALKPRGLFFAGYPMSEEICCIGGNVAENAGGGRAIKYGVTGAYVLGAEIVTGAGEVLTLGGRRLKDVTGYNLLPLFVGSEGTLGLFTKITLRVIPRPERRAVLLAEFPTTQAAAEAVLRLRSGRNVYPSSIEFMDGTTARETNATIPHASRWEIPETAEALLLIELDGRRENVESALKAAGDDVSALGGRVVYQGTDDATMEQAWRVRKQIPWYVKRASGQYHSLEDVVVPPAAIAELVAYVDSRRQRHNVPVAMFGHAGDGNFHVTPMKPSDMRPEEWPATLDILLRELYEEVRSLGGTMSGEHGVGRKRVKYLSEFLSPETIAALHGVKKLFDPNGVLNPGVILDDSVNRHQ